MIRTHVLAAALFGLAACSTPTPEQETLSQRFEPMRREWNRMACERHNRDEKGNYVKKRDCTPPGPPPNPNARRTALFCYRTWAQPDCYVEPLPDAESRLMGVLLPDAAAIQPVASMNEATQVVEQHRVESHDLAPPPGVYQSSHPRLLMPPR